ncbi:hypothetical protein CONLIGDRAFT_677321 [Coniochaeta ligniaria NRRL 30616]|uniref:Uncharacterized protein n=1 Tax=Coniochaeta ligniaria NRRL 30616 TaxID=1408157 RepID=A0A1J7J0F4_9PEZI|nr:hypothetical protein CONLIGDRAFT_677321 [Coniochaeta ligniaria NRRL 30616]
MSGQYGGSLKRSLEEGGTAPQPKKTKATRELASPHTPQASRERRQGVPSLHHLDGAAAQADQVPLKRGRGRPRGHRLGRDTTQRTQHIQSGRPELSSPLARQSGQGLPRQPTAALASPDALPAHTNADVAWSGPEFSSPLARQSGQGRSSEPTAALASPDVLPARADADAAWVGLQRRMLGLP